jgi:hypothetical protein
MEMVVNKTGVPGISKITMNRMDDQENKRAYKSKKQENKGWEGKEAKKQV